MPYTVGISIVLNSTYSFQKPDGRSAYPEDSLLGLAYMSFLWQACWKSRKYTHSTQLNENFEKLNKTLENCFKNYQKVLSLLTDILVTFRAF